MKKIIGFLVFTLFLSLQSCVEEEKDKFPDSAANRMTAELNRINEILQGAPNGWLMEYYAEEDPAILGGINFIVSFENGIASIATETSHTDYPPGTVVESEYQMISDQGPVLSFNTYNQLLHYWSNPSQSDVNGFSGDYEFVVMSAEPNRIEMVGKKHGKKILMTALEQDVNWTSYLDDVIAMQKKVEEYFFYVIYSDSKVIGAGIYENSNQRFQLFGEETDLGDYTQNVIYTRTGIKFYEPITIDGVTAQNFQWNASEESYISTDPGVNMVLKVEVPSNIIGYADYLGDYEMTYVNGDDSVVVKDISFVAKEFNKTFTLKGFHKELEAVATFLYDRVRNNTYIIIYTQNIELTLNYSRYDAIFLYPWTGGAWFTNQIGYAYAGLPEMIDGEFESLDFTQNFNGLWFIAYYGGSPTMIDGGDPDCKYKDVKMVKK